MDRKRNVVTEQLGNVRVGSGRLEDSKRQLRACLRSLREPEREHELADQTSGILALIHVGDTNPLSLIEVIHYRHVSIVFHLLGIALQGQKTHCSP